MRKCEAKTKKGVDCKRSPMKDSSYCYFHSFGKLKNVPFWSNSTVHFLFGLVLTIILYLIGPSLNNQIKMLSNDKISHQKLSEISDSSKERKAEHEEEMTTLNEMKGYMFEIKNNENEKMLKKNLVNYEVDELTIMDNLYYRAIRLKNKSDDFIQKDFTVEIEGDSIFADFVNGPRPIGGGMIQFLSPKIEANICKIKLVELKPKETILVGLYSKQRWNLVNIKGYRN